MYYHPKTMEIAMKMWDYWVVKRWHLIVHEYKSEDTIIALWFIKQ